VRFLLSNWDFVLLNQKVPFRFRPSPQKSKFPRLGNQSKWAVFSWSPRLIRKKIPGPPWRSRSMPARFARPRKLAFLERLGVRRRWSRIQPCNQRIMLAERIFGPQGPQRPALRSHLPAERRVGRLIPPAASALPLRKPFEALENYSRGVHTPPGPFGA
jgi:hypothetical protein